MTLDKKFFGERSAEEKSRRLDWKKVTGYDIGSITLNDIAAINIRQAACTSRASSLSAAFSRLTR